ncbi:ABC transporter substrate-binding protein [Pseudorhodoferax sp.]|uniref:ABC transporter substrate-binding protein n=1 Tax=Pseudorhodoferax sp. TaxID=1993553 RepID=UPI0039E215A9
MQTPAPRRRGLVAAALAGAACVAAPVLLRAQERPELPRLTLAAGPLSTCYYLPLAIAEQLGYFRAEGLDVAIGEHASGGSALQAVLRGAAQVGAGAFEHALRLHGRGQTFQAFVLQTRAPQIAVGVSTRTLARYHDPAILRGRSIGVSSAGASTQLVARLLLARAGVAAGDVRFVEVGTGMQALQALRDGRLDAISNTEPLMTMLEQQGDVRIVADTRSLKGSHELFGGPMPAACLHAPAAFVAAYPATCQALASAIVRALKWLQTAGPGDIVRSLPENYLLGGRALYLASFQKVRETFSPDGLIPAEGGATALRAMARAEPGFDPGRIDPDKLYTNLFARRAKERFKL